MAGPSIPPRVEGRGLLQVSLQFKTEGGLHQPLPLRQSRVSGSAARARSQIFRPHPRTQWNDAVPAYAGK